MSCGALVFNALKGTQNQNFSLIFISYICYLIEKESCTKFGGVLIGFHEIMKLDSFEFGVSVVIPANVQNISALIFFAYFC